MPKLVKDKVIKVRAVSGTVMQQLNRALAKAKQQRWTKVCIIGEGEHGGYYLCSKMHDYYKLGMIEEMKNEILRRVPNDDTAL